ncbi:MAG: hypothetical protein JXK07_06315 [Spirochaetes bacterium]|nr:hypothetical protein [Spirochaetota bacterium]
MMKKIAVIILFLISVTFGQIKLAGEQDGVFDSATYIVSDELIVPEGKNLDFLPNATLLFLPYVGIRVEGQLKMKNATLSSQDSTGNWNGIEVGKNGKIYLDNVSIHRSVMGISVPDTSAIQYFSSITFTGNKSTLRIADSPVFIREGIPFTFSKVVMNDPKVENKNFTSDRLLNTDIEKHSSISAAKWISAITTFTFIAGSIAAGVESNRKYSKYEQSQEKERIEKYKEQSIVYRNIAIGTGIGAGVTLAALSICFAIDIKKD